MNAEDVVSVLRLLGVKRIKTSNDGFVHCQCFFAPFADEHYDHYDGKPSMWIKVDQGTSYCECWTCGSNDRAGKNQSFVDAVESFNSLCNGRYSKAVEKAYSCEKSTGHRRSRAVYTPSDHTADYEARYLKPAGLPRNWLKKKGICKSNTTDIFRIGVDSKNGSVLFPIINRVGMVVGAQARPITRDSKAGKYYSVYEATQKSHHLFGEHLLNLVHEDGVTRFTGDTIVVFEGPLDTMHAHEVGVPDVVGIMGSKISPVQAQLLDGWTKPRKKGEEPKMIALVLDPDKAGRSGSYKSLNQVFLEHAPGALVKAFAPPKDPKEMTSEEFDILLNGDPAWRKKPVKDRLADLIRAGTRRKSR